MRKRKPPYILVSVLIVLGAMLFFVNGGMRNFASNDQPVELAPPTSGESRETDSTKTLAERTKNAARGAQDTMSKEGPAMVKGDVPTIQLPSSQIQKPQPNDSNISSQWYTPEARKPGSK
ncbi:MAG: hypothetical protein M9921_04510 [Fimbriimonadaceae bacterium]|nr:hypothetical protein [Chthonomonadaceae bacterium]MCO5296098.1 hypothetical protein [Fimbriimonadaceae bacterium]